MLENNSDVLILGGNSNIPLTQKIANSLNVKIAKANIGRFSDGEIMVKIDENIRGKHIYLIQSVCPPNPSESLMELLTVIDACKRASAAKIIAVIPYYGFARQDRRPYSTRVPITAKLVADMLQVAGVNRVITLDLHSDQIQGFFNIPVDNVYAAPVLIKDIIKNYKIDNTIIVSPDVGGVLRARAVAKLLQTDLAIIDKRRPAPNKTEVMNVIGNINNKDCIIIDDMVDTAGTLYNAAAALLNEGAESVSAYITHPVLSGNALDNIKNSKLKELVFTDSIDQSQFIQSSNGKARSVSVSDFLADTILRVHTQSSVSEIIPNL